MAKAPNALLRIPPSPSLFSRWQGCAGLSINDLLSGDEPLHPLAVRNFSCVDVAFRIDSDHVQAHELAAVLARSAHLGQDFAVVTVEEPDVAVGEIGNK